MPSRTLNRVLWAAVFIVLAALGLTTRADLEVYFAGVGKLDVREEPAGGTVYLRWRGQIDAPMESRLIDAFDRYRGERRKFVLSLSSPGGMIDHGARVVRLLQKIGETNDIETVVEARGRCASMCVPVYLQGQRRTAAANARFLFHEVSFNTYLSKEASEVPASATESATDRFFNAYFKPAGVPASWIAKVRANMTGGHNVWKSARELVDENAGIVQQLKE